MCHNSGIESEQIERYMAFGLPQKAVRSVKSTMRKREQQKRKEQQQQQQQQKTQNVSSSNNNSSDSNSSSGENSDSDIKPTATTLSSRQQEQKQQPITATAVTVTEPVTADETTVKATADETVKATAEETVKATADETVKALTETVALTAATHNNNSNKSILQIPKFCGRFRKMQQEQQQQESKESATAAEHMTTATATVTTTSQQQQQQRKMSSMEPSMDDALAIGTQLTRKFADRCHCLIDKLQASRLYIILTRTTQPAHLIAICILSFVLLTVGPDLTTTSTTDTTTPSKLSTTTTTTTQTRNVGAGADVASSTLPTLAYLGAFSTHFGSQIWMTFVSGLSLYFSLPRHTFGQCQQILFPKYFALNAMLSITMLIIYVKYFLSGWTTASGVQLGTLTVTAAIEVVVRLYLAPPMLRLMHEKYRIEGAIGSGQEVGSLVQGDLVECPHYQRIHKAFRRIHMTIAIGNMIVLLATCLQLYFLALKIRIS